MPREHRQRQVLALPAAEGRQEWLQSLPSWLTSGARPLGSTRDRRCLPLSLRRSCLGLREGLGHRGALLGRRFGRGFCGLLLQAGLGCSLHVFE